MSEKWNWDQDFPKTPESFKLALKQQVEKEMANENDRSEDIKKMVEINPSNTKKKQSVWQLIFQRNTSEWKLKTRKTSCTPSAHPKKRVSGTTPCLLHVRKHSDSLIQTHGSLTHKNGKNHLNNPAK